VKTILLAVFLVYSIPLFRLRYTWRATVYRRWDWKINILPWFGHDLAALFSNRYFQNAAELAMARRFRWYVSGYLALLVVIVWLP
jgi:hypothetical protein